MAKKDKRKDYFIEKKFQTKFILKFCVITGMSSLLIGGLILLLSRNSTTVAIENTKVIVKQTSDFILPLITWTIIITTFFSASIVIITTLFTSHKIAGPLYRLKKEIDTLGKGNLKINFQIRTKDQFQEFAQSLDNMCVSLKEKHQGLKTKFGNLKSYLEKNDFKLSNEQKGEFSGMLDEVEKILNQFKT